ncbi:MAG: amidohydrolase [Planctomycetes bacterium]|nr:amidohydrolase [Planctomycetota bacterium]
MKSKSVLIAVAVLFCAGLLHAGEQKGASTIRAEKKFVLDWLSQPAVVKKFGEISEAIWRYAELGLQEFKSSGLLVKTLENEGFHVDTGLAGMPTCFVASYGTGQPVIGILAEFDALPTLSQKGEVPNKEPLVEGAPGHGCGHNLMGSAATATAIAVKRCMEKYHLRGTIKLFGSPAEETLISRPYMVRAGLFEGVDAVINNHASSRFSTAYGVTGTAVYSLVFVFTGKTAHSGSSPWSGRSALDAVEIMNISTNYLREHLPLTHRLHYVILEGGEAPNVVPDRASVWYYLRNTDEQLEDMYQRVINCAKGAALATGTELAQVHCLSAIHQSHHNRTLAELFQENIELVGMPQWTDEEQAFAKALQKTLGKEEKGMPADVNKLKDPEPVLTTGGASDHGDVTLIVPTATIRFPGEVPGAIGHHWSMAACNSGSAAWKGLNAGGKAMAASAVDLLTRPDVLQKAKDEFAAYSKKHPYKSFLPPDCPAAAGDEQDPDGEIPAAAGKNVTQASALRFRARFGRDGKP